MVGEGRGGVSEGGGRRKLVSRIMKVESTQAKRADGTCYHQDNDGLLSQYNDEWI